MATSAHSLFRVSDDRVDNYCRADSRRCRDGANGVRAVQLQRFLRHPRNRSTMSLTFVCTSLSLRSP